MGADRTYETDAIRVFWESAKCIHTARCLQALPEVFDTRRRPWVDVHGAGAGAIADAVERCPTGALRYERLDGAPAEQPQRPTVIVAIENGPLMVLGELKVEGAEGELLAEQPRATLCRCGLSRNQPFCDNSHLKRMWQSGPSGAPATPLPEPAGGEGATQLIAQRDASLKVRGDVVIHDGDGRRVAAGSKALLCRCGHSANKPFCDGSHERYGFRSTPADVPRDRLQAETPAAFTRNDRVPDPEALTD